MSEPAARLAVVFDLDGTLIDSVGDVRAALNRVFAEDGGRQFGDEDVREMVGHGAEALFQKAFAAAGGGPTGPLDDYIKRFQAHYMEVIAAGVSTFPGVHEALEALAAKDTVMGICTNKPRDTTLECLRAASLDRFFAAVVCPEDTPHRKPDGRHILATLEAMNGALECAVMVGDNEADAAASHDAGIPFIAVTFGYCRTPVVELNAERVIDRMTELASAITFAAGKMRYA